MEQKQLEELCRRGADRFQPLFSRFLDLNEQRIAEAAARKYGADYALFGGAEGCERRMLGVGAEAPQPADFPVDCLLITRRSGRFGQPLTHRDVLGTVMGLGLEREMIGDIVVREEGAYLFCVKAMTDLLQGALTRVGRTDTSCALSPPPEGPLKTLKEVRVQVSSPRVDTVCAHLFNLSRGDTQELIRQGRIAVDDRVCLKSDLKLSEGQVLSVRGYGRARFSAFEGLSKKGKMNLTVELYS